MLGADQGRTPRRSTVEFGVEARSDAQAGHGRQQGDPTQGARAIIVAVAAERSPVHLLIGGDALDRLRAKRDAMRRETDGWEDMTRSTDVPAGASA